MRWPLPRPRCCASEQHQFQICHYEERFFAKGDFFSEILHVLRREAGYAEYVSQNMRLVNCDDLRDRKAITRLATGFLKLLFPDMAPTEEEFRTFCVKPAVALRQRVRDELHKLDHEYTKVSIGFE